ncbi:ribosome silencing factor [Candidatus Saganbacteria bacterium]|nr:ribosome silencing factor [Candidatus Saganbacteria bacterium]
MRNKQDTDKLIKLVIDAAEDKKAINPIIIDVTRAGKFADYMIIISGDSTPQLKAIVREIESRVKARGIKGIVWEGSKESGWLIYDLGDILVHIMSEKERAFYDLEGLWGKEAVVYHE